MLQIKCRDGLKNHPTIYYLEVTHFTDKDTHWLKVKGLKKIFYLCLLPQKNLKFHKILCWGFTSGWVVKNLPAMQELQETQVGSLSWKDSPGEGNSNPSSILVWRIPWTEEPCGLQSIGSQRIGHNWSDLAKIFVLVGRELKWHLSLISVLDYQCKGGFLLFLTKDITVLPL